MKYLKLLILLIILVSCNETEVNPPKRHSNISPNSTWAGGLDGGSWFLCNKIEKEKYYCIVYNEYTGNPISKGNYLLKHYTWNKINNTTVYSNTEKQLKELSYNAYDGIFIQLSNSHILIPDGIIDYQFGDGHGKKIIYKIGSEISEKEY